MEIIVIAVVMVLEVVLTAFIIALATEKKNERPLVSQLRIKQRNADDLVAESAPYQGNNFAGDLYCSHLSEFYGATPLDFVWDYRYLH